MGQRGHRETRMKCVQTDCDKDATHLVHWPMAFESVQGQEPVMCDECTAKAQGIAEAMGFYVPVQLLVELK